MLSPLLEALAREAAQPIGRKVLVGPRRGVCRELLRQLALATGGWVGFEPATPRDIAGELVAHELTRQGLRVADEFDELALIDTAIDEAMAERGGEVLRRFVEGAGLREAMAASMRALRLAGVDAPVLLRAGFRDRDKRAALSRVLDRYERLLRRERTTDNAGVLRLAVSAIEAGAVTLPEVRYSILPGQTRRGLTGRLLELLLERGAMLLHDDAVHGLEPPPALLAAGAATASSPLSWLHAVEAAPAEPEVPVRLELFAAGSVNDEVREVLRRVVGLGLSWDEAEIVASDPMTYGAALDALARRLEIPVSYAAGLPIGRTRTGRALDAYLRWVRDDFPEALLRTLIARGDVRAPGGSSGALLARRLQRMLIGRGRERYLSALARAERRAGLHVLPDVERTPEEAASVRAQEQLALADLGAILRTLFAALPPAAAGPSNTPVMAPSALARGALAFLALVPAETGVEATARERLTRRLTRLADTAHRATTLEGAIAVIVAKLDARVPAPAAQGASPWTSTGGRLHLSDIDHGGCTGRAATFVVGLDALRFPGTSTHDTLLNDEDRRRLAEHLPFAPVPTTGERATERRHGLARLLARLRGRVTLSYAAWEATEARTVAPSPELLQALRLQLRDPAADYEKLHTTLGRYASAIPRGEGRLDEADVWLGNLERGGLLVAGTDIVRLAYPGLDRGLTARDARAAGEFTAWHGRITPRPQLDPRAHPELVVSAHQLETLGTCPHRYLLEYVLRAAPPQEADFMPDRWLTAAYRGRLLHAVYRLVLQRARARQCAPEDAAFETLALLALEEVVAEAREDRLPPGEAVFEMELEELRQEMRLFVQMTREHGAPWVELEMNFGRAKQPAVNVELMNQSISVTGRVDRIDREADGRLVVIDYKTGSPDGFGGPDTVFQGGRRLQHALYMAVARRVLGADVARSEYHFPTNRGEIQRLAYEEKQLRRGRIVVTALLDMVRAGHFFPTDEPEDCRYCAFAPVCRVRQGSRIDSPMAEWSQRWRAWLPELYALRQLREKAP